MRLFLSVDGHVELDSLASELRKQPGVGATIERPDLPGFKGPGDAAIVVAVLVGGVQILASAVLAWWENQKSPPMTLTITRIATSGELISATAPTAAKAYEILMEAEAQHDYPTDGPWPQE
jgi:Effector Associated Constant Component 1